ncbi:MAG: hypothetical protein RSD40_05440 [Bacilli bacterium]
MNEVFQIKELIKKAISIVGGSGAGVTLKNADDCSLFISNLFEYRDWHDLKKANYLSYDVNVFNAAIEYNVEIKDSFVVDNFVLNLNKQLHKPFPKTIEIIKNNSQSVIDFGISEDEFLKTLNIVGLQLEHTLIVSEHENTDIFNKLKQNFKNESIISFGEKESVALDPWSSMIRTNTLEKVFSGTEFSAIFIQLIRDLQFLGIRVALKDVIGFLDLKEMISLITVMDKNIRPSSYMLRIFMKKLKINIDEGSEISVEQQTKYYKAVSGVYNYLNHMKSLYDCGAFKSLFGEDEILNAMAKRENIVLPDKFLDDKLYCLTLMYELERAFETYDKSTDGIYEQFMYWMFIPDLKKFDNASIHFIYNYKFLKSIVASSIYANNLNLCAINSEQFLIGKNKFLNFSNEVKDKLLGSVLSWPQRFWYQNSTILNYLYNDEYYFIYPAIISETDIEFRNFYCKKVSIIKDDE